MADYEDGDLPKFDKQKYHRHLRGWFSYAFARYVQGRSSKTWEQTIDCASQVKCSS